ncbi:MAG: BatD family protein [Flavobacteriaceae bacterium]|nr:BatD family protein [Flavobacteriaceae bacterium]
MMQRSSMRFLYYFLVLGTFTIQGQVSFEAKVSKKRLGLNERLRIDFEMNENGDNFNPPNFINFHVVSGPQQSVSRSWVNGVQSFSKTYTYFLTPKKKGKIVLGQAEVNINGEVYKTSPIEIEIISAVEKPNDPNNTDNIIDGNIHLVAEISKNNPYLNEGITVTYKLYFRNPISISDVQELESPSYGDFWSHLIKIGRAEINMRGSYKGEPYNEVIWRKAVLYPQKTGKLILEPLTLNLSLNLPSNRKDLFGRRILTQAQKMITTGKDIIRVKGLPQNNKPDNFSGAVGEFDFDVILNKNALKATESFQVKIKVKGKGNLKLFNLPPINVPNTLEVYEPEHEENIQITVSGMEGFIEDNYTIVPEYQGKYPIPPVKFTYFNPQTALYKTLDSQDLLVDVFDGPQAGSKRANTVVSESKQIIETNENAFRFIKLNTELTPVNKKIFWMSNRFWILLFTPLLLIITAYLFKFFVFEKTEDASTSKQRKAQYLAKKYLSSAKKVFHNQILFYEALERALHNYLKAKLKIETTELSKSKIEILLLDKKVKKQTALDYVSVIENCELARYAPGSSVNIQSDFEKASRLIATIDKQL